jgi:hypothetical protein
VKITGGCHCGNIRYEAEIDPAHVGICHCTDCQTLSGGAYRVSVRAAADQVRFSGGAPTEYVKVADSGNRRVQTFCPKCGAPLYASNETDRRWLTLRIGAIDQRRELRPVRQIWHRSALPWSADLRGVPAIERE